MEANNRSRPISNGMDVYFVRHGQTASNAHFVQQSANTPLSDKGREQVLSAAEWLRPANATCIITSDYKRAKESAGIIGNILGLTPIESTLFHEVERPSSLCGKSHFDPRTAWYLFKLYWYRKDLKYRYKDAENLTNVHERIDSALAYLEKLEKKHKSVIVVSHTAFINLLVAYMCKNRKLTHIEMLLRIFHIISTKNGAIIHLQHDNPKKARDCAWKLVKSA